MLKINKLNNEMLTSVILKNDTLKNAMYWVSEKLDIIKPLLKNWSVGFYQHNFIEFDENLNGDFECIINKYIDIYDLSDELKKEFYNIMITNNETILEMSCFIHDFFKQEILLEVEYIKNTDFEILLKDEIMNIIELERLDNYYINDNKEVLKIEIVK